MNNIPMEIDTKIEDGIMTEAYGTTLTIVENYTDQLAAGGPSALFETLVSLQGALKEVQSTITRKFRSKTMENNRHVWEGWTVQEFINELEPIFDMIMSNNSCYKPFKTKQEVRDWCKSEQPYYKEEVPEVANYFINKSKLTK